MAIIVFMIVVFISGFSSVSALNKKSTDLINENSLEGIYPEGKTFASF